MGAGGYGGHGRLARKRWRGVRIRRPGGVMRVGVPAVALFAVFVAVGYAAAGSRIPDRAGVFYGCVNDQAGALRLLSDPSRCPKAIRLDHRMVGERVVSWSQRGPVGATGRTGSAGASGADGATRLGVRATSGAIAMTCTQLQDGSYSCSGAATNVAACDPGEEAVSGGYTVPPRSGSGPVVFYSVYESRPDPASGTPTGWAVTATASEQSLSPAPAAPIEVWAVCRAA